ncbi:uncharacterized protein [Physcomitrium patens]|uniref:uncharacterized protein isoform X1 n=1 Tax=Physcomitrium patens TaxID=3218 RepID=UPI000D151DDC|nr:uncharacterized protein LOC112287499 isoform X1 [Physcomitrium patens]|eukprot:XP_024386307.1 uncharacterized protein LOC112287499 isoform X1 [Physcomitrella patens]
MVLTALSVISVDASREHKELHVPAIFVFGDSLADAGTNTFIPQVTVRADFPPYGKTFFWKPTGRFTNGRTIVDFISSRFLHQRGQLRLRRERAPRIHQRRSSCCVDERPSSTRRYTRSVQPPLQVPILGLGAPNRACGIYPRRLVDHRQYDYGIPYQLKSVGSSVKDCSSFVRDRMPRHQSGYLERSSRICCNAPSGLP